MREPLVKIKSDNAAAGCLVVTTLLIIALSVIFGASITLLLGIYIWADIFHQVGNVPFHLALCGTTAFGLLWVSKEVRSFKAFLEAAWTRETAREAG